MSYARAAAAYYSAAEPEGPETCDLEPPDEWVCEECGAQLEAAEDAVLVEIDALEGQAVWHGYHQCAGYADRGRCRGTTCLPGHRE